MAEHQAVQQTTHPQTAVRPEGVAPARTEAPLISISAAAPVLETTLSRIDGGSGARLVTRLQGVLGNASVHAMLTAQRHPAGAPLSVTQNQSQLVAELTNPPPLTAASAVAQASGTPAPAPTSPPAMSLATAQQVLTKSYGAIKTIVPGSIVLLEGRPALWAKYDQNNRGRNNGFVTPNRPWQDGDAQLYIPGLEGFADSETNTVYIDAHSPLPTVTAHEMLHINTAADFRGKVGETVNEGTTEYLALKALTAAGIPTAGTGGASAYPDQRAIVQSLIGLVGEATLIQAYFGGADLLINTFEALKGSTWSLFKARAEALDKTTTASLCQPPSLQAKIDACNHLLDWWVSDADLDALAQIYNNSSDSEKAAIRNSIAPRIRDLTDIGQRTRLRVILGTVG